VLHPDSARWHTAEQALTHPELIRFAAMIEHDLCDLREYFSPCALWAARALSHFANKEGVNINDKDHRVAISSDDGDDDSST